MGKWLFFSGFSGTFQRITQLPNQHRSLRHALAAAAIKAGWSAKKVASQLGDSSTAITLDMYVEDAPSWQDVAKLRGDLYSTEQER